MRRAARALVALVALALGAAAFGALATGETASPTPVGAHASGDLDRPPSGFQLAPSSPGAALEVALVTMGPGEVYWQRFGHNAIRVVDRAAGTDTLYNYGMFDFAEEDFFLNFIRGRMRYSLLAARTGMELRQYRDEGRWVDVQWLALRDEEKAALRDFLDWNARPENRHYRYDYFESNCSTKVRDALDRALGGELRRALAPAAASLDYRGQALRLTRPDRPLALGIHAGLGPYADAPRSRWEESFVPMVLEDAVRDARRADGSPLVRAEERILPARIGDAPASPPDWRLAFAGVGIALAALVLGTARARRRRRFLAVGVAAAAWLLATIGGLALLGLWTLTEHRSAWANENLLLFSPLCLLLLPGLAAMARGRRPGSLARVVSAAVALLAVVAAALHLLGLSRQDHGDWIALWLPLHLALAFVLRSRRRWVAAR